MPGGQFGTARHLDGDAKLDADALAFVEKTVKVFGITRAAKILQTSDTVIDRILGPGILRRHVAARISTRILEIKRSA